MQDTKRKAASAEQKLAFVTLQEHARCQAQLLDERSESSRAYSLSSYSARTSTCTTSEMAFNIEELKLALEVQAKLGLERL